jgi:hypothetical protein
MRVHTPFELTLLGLSLTDAAGILYIAQGARVPTNTLLEE